MRCRRGSAAARRSWKRPAATHQPKHVLLCVVSQNQYNELIEIIDEFDTTAFVITTDATDMHGMGFSFKFRV